MIAGGQCYSAVEVVEVQLARFFAVFTCAGQFEDVSVVLWVDRVVLWWVFHSILCCCFLKRCFKLKKVVSVCCNWLKIASCRCRLSYGVA